MTRPPIVAVVAVYLLAFAFALRIFLLGDHSVALLIVVGVWVILAVWLRIGGAR